MRANGERFEEPLADSLGANAILGSVSSPGKIRTASTRGCNRWRFGVQRELFGNTSVEVAYSGQYADRVDRAIPARTFRSSYYASGNVRDASAQTLLQQQVTNPFHIDNFASLRTSDPALYERMANNAFFQARTTQRRT